MTLQIRKEQMKAFEDAAMRNFDAQVAKDLKARFPKQCEAMGPSGARTVVRMGRERAGEHGFKMNRSVRIYVDLMLRFGSYFDRDPQLPWAAEVLAKEGFENERQRIDALRVAAIEFMRKLAGPGGESVKRVLDKLRRERPEGFAASGVSPFDRYMVQRLAALYPEKAAAAGEAALRGVVRSAVEAARHHGLTNEAGVILLSVLKFMLGSDFDRDPQFVWAKAVLENTAPADPGAKARRLHEAAMGYLGRFIS